MRQIWKLLRSFVWEEVFVLILLIAAFLHFLIFIYLSANNFQAPRRRAIFLNFDETYNFQNVCALPIYDYWDKDITKFIDFDYDPLSNCDRKYAPLTELKNGNWSIVSEDPEVKCRARCHRRFTDYYNKMDNWTNEPGPVDCETLETVCSKRGSDFYGYLHTQIVPKSPINPEPPTQPRPDVFVFLMDSLSFGDAKRSFPKSLSLFSSHFQAVEFPFVNKVGENSQPNSIALWFGKMITRIDNTLVGGQYEEAEWTNKYFCNNFLDNETNLFSEFGKRGYKTLLAEDWRRGALNYPYCKGFDIPPVDHYMRTFQNALEVNGEELTRNHLYAGKNCRENHDPMIEYSEQFMGKYRDEPKFSWIWAIEAGHDNPSGYMRFDKVLLDYLERNKEVLDNSFVFLMSDHGFRVGPPVFLESVIGAFEMNNPYLSISVPRKYRNSTRMLELMRKNAEKLQTHFDTRSTILDILEYQPSSNFTSSEVLHVPNERGHSLLRHQPDTPRTCGTLPIPIEYCICRMKLVDVYDPDLMHYLGTKLADQVNLRLRTGNISNLCIDMEFSKTTSLQQLAYKDDNREYETYIVSIAMRYPSFARFKSTLKIWKSNKQIEFGEITRTNRYSSTGDCVGDGALRSMCFCKNNSFFTLCHYYFAQVSDAVEMFFDI